MVYHDFAKIKVTAKYYTSAVCCSQAVNNTSE